MQRQSRHALVVGEFVGEQCASDLAMGGKVILF
jgi:hypothetical protein